MSMSCLVAASETDRFARSDDRTSEVSRGHSSLETWKDSLGTSRYRKGEATDKSDRRAKRRPERSPAISGVNGVASTNG